MLACLSPTSPLLTRGALRFVEASGAAADRPVAVGARLAGFLTIDADFDGFQELVRRR